MKIFYQLSTHWDREWYKPFQGFRYYLVDMMDELLDALEEGKIQTFSFDGQTIVLEDYLEIRSENRERLTKLIEAGRLKVGPWYVMPDELIVSGESLIENFLVGHKVAQSFGADAWKFGYVNDVFGHIAQFPQILNGFDIKGVFLGRGAGYERQFLWKAPDGSECFVFNYNYARIKRGFDECEEKSRFLKEYIEEHEIPVAIINYTDDHAKVDEKTFLFEETLHSLPYEITEGLEKFADEVKKYRNLLPEKRGELIETARTMNDFRAVTNSLSSYYPLKQQNDECENLLYHVLAPMIVLGENLGISGKRAFWEMARKYLLKNQPHDSICGCSIDGVHRDMPYRYRQLQAITDVVKEDFFQKVYQQESSDTKEWFLYIWNIGSVMEKRVVTVDIDFPMEWENAFYTNVRMYPEYMFKIVDEDENEIPYQILKMDKNVEVYERQDIHKVFRYTVALRTSLKSYGVTKFKIIPDDTLKRKPLESPMGSLWAENEYMELHISETGTIHIKNKETGKTYDGINTYVEDGDAGNGWFYEPFGYGTPSVLSSGSSVEVLQKGELVNSFRIVSYMDVPKEGKRENFSRGTESIKMRIETIVTLLAGEKKVLFETKILNAAKDHRVRVLFPTAIEGETYTSSQAFCYNERKRGVTLEGINSREPESYEKNTSGIIGVSDGKEKAYFIGKGGFHEAGVYPDGTIAVTMFRSFGQAFHQPVTVEAQLQQSMCFQYAFSVSDEGLWNEQLEMAGHTFAQMCQKNLKEMESLLHVDEREIVISTIKPAESKKGWIIRLFNPTKEPLSTTLHLSMDIQEVHEVTLSEEKMKKLELKKNQLQLVFEPYKIKTLYVEG